MKWSEIRSAVPNSLWPWNSPGQNTGVGSLPLLQGIFWTQGLNPGPLNCRQILYQLSHSGSPARLEWVAYPSPADLPSPGMEQGFLALQVDSLPTELSGKPQHILISLNMVCRISLHWLYNFKQMKTTQINVATVKSLQSCPTLCWGSYKWMRIFQMCNF